MTEDWNIDFRALRYFVAVAEERGFSRAAARLHVAQPALSRQVRKLEDDLGVELFARSKKGVELTEAGEVLLSRAYVLFNQVQQTYFDVTGRTDEPRGTVTVGMPPTPGEMIGPVLLERVKARYPNVELRFREGFSDALQRRLHGNEIGIAVMHDPAPHPDIRVTRLLTERMWIVGKAEALTKESYTLAEATQLPLVMPSRPNFIRVLLERHMDPDGPPLNIVQRADGVWQLKALVRYGHGFTFLTYGAVVSEIKLGVLRAAPVTDPSIVWDLCVAMRTDQYRKIAAAAVEGLIREIVEEFVRAGLWR
jgi:LysR family nitrogen assimilation transcriptional regulator